MASGLGQDRIEAYRRQGFVAPVPVLSPDEAADYRRRFESYEAATGDWYPSTKGQKIYFLQTWAAELASHPALLDAVESVIGPDILVWGCSLFIKEAGDTTYVSWHQDSTYWGLSETDVVSGWIALSPATRKSGCMKMIPGSQAWDQAPHVDTLDKDNLLTRGQAIAVDIDEDAAAYLELRPGEASLHNVRTVHGSSPNQGDDRRIGLAIRYVAPHVRQVKADQDSAWLVRGIDRHRHFVHETPPKGDMDPAAVAEHARVMKLRQDVLYDGVEGQPAHI